MSYVDAYRVIGQHDLALAISRSLPHRSPRQLKQGRHASAQVPRLHQAFSRQLGSPGKGTGAATLRSILALFVLDCWKHSQADAGTSLYQHTEEISHRKAGGNRRERGSAGDSSAPRSSFCSSWAQSEAGVLCGLLSIDDVPCLLECSTQSSVIRITVNVRGAAF